MARPKAMRACAPLLAIALLLATLCDARSTPYRPPTGPYRGGAAALAGGGVRSSSIGELVQRSARMSKT